MKQAMPLMMTPPEEAAKNIDRSNLFEIDPDTYSGLKTELEPDALAIERVPAQIEPETDKFMRQSEQHSSLVANDIDKMNVFEKRAAYYKQKIIDIPETSREINEYISKKMDTVDGKIEEGEEAYLQDLIKKEQLLNQNAEAYGIGDKEEFAVDVLSAAGDMVRSYTDNKALIASTVGTGAVIGGVAGSAAPVVGTVAGLIAGATKGAVVANVLVGTIDAYKQTSRGLYKELMTATDDQGKPLNIPHPRMVNVSQAVGALSGLAGGLAGKALASNNPFLKQFLNPKLAAKYIGKSPALIAKMDVLGGIAKSVFSEGSEEGFQEFIQTVGGIFGKMDETEASFINALDESISPENLKRYGKAALVGGATGGFVQTVTSAPAYNSIKRKQEEINYVTQRKTETLEAQNNMLELAEDVKQMKANDLAPAEMNRFVKGVFSSLGIDENVYVQLDDMRKFSSTPEKAAAVRRAIDPTGDLTKMAQELNTPLSIPKSDFLNIVMEFPDVSDYMRLTPDGENPLAVRNEGKEFAGKLQEAEQNRTAMLEKMGFSQESQQTAAELEASKI